EKSYNERALPAMGRREFDAVIPLLESIEKDASAFLVSFEKDFAAWNKAKQKLLEIEARCNKLMNWPPLAGQANNLRVSVKELITETERELTYAQGAAKLQALETRLTNLNDAAKEQNLSDDTKIDDFAKFRAHCREGIDADKKTAEVELQALEEK